MLGIKRSSGAKTLLSLPYEGNVWGRERDLLKRHTESDHQITLKLDIKQ